MIVKPSRMRLEVSHNKHENALLRNCHNIREREGRLGLIPIHLQYTSCLRILRNGNVDDRDCHTWERRKGGVSYLRKLFTITRRRTAQMWMGRCGKGQHIIPGIWNLQQIMIMKRVYLSLAKKQNKPWRLSSAFPPSHQEECWRGRIFNAQY